jgi:hypothetical protein
VVLGRDGCGRVAVFVLGGAEPVAVAVPTARVVPAFDPVEDREHELLARVPALLVEELELQGAEEALDDAVVVAVADASHRTQQPCRTQATSERPARVLPRLKKSSQRCRVRPIVGARRAPRREFSI